MASVSLEQLTCTFDSPTDSNLSVRAVDGIDLNINNGEFFTLLGPSGSGKTTCLRAIGGFVRPTSGRVLIDSADVTTLPPYRRQVNTVFQDYALFPHMTVEENIAYGLMIRGIDRDQRERQTRQMLNLIALPEVGARRPSQLSGGQRQRVALARALINQPKVLLLDEPLGALDLKLREQMQSELKSLQRKLGITFLFITHDQHEALSMSDRVGVFNLGKLEQVGTPFELYEQPKTRFVAQFLGAANVVEGDLAKALTGQSAAMLRPERIQLVTQNERAGGTVEEIQYFGPYSRVRTLIDRALNFSLLVDIPADRMPSNLQLGQRLALGWDQSAVHPLIDR